MDARSFIFHAAYGSGCPVPGWTESLHVIRTLTTHSHPMSIVTAFGTFLAGQIMAVPRGFFLPARAVRVSDQEVWPFAAQSAFFICTRGDREARLSYA